MITLFTIKTNNKYEEIIKYSRFISLIFKVYSKEDVEYYLNEVENNFPNATHYCYGYVIDDIIRSSDDGEPSKTAGAPILNQITSNNLNYVLIVVVRFFGGVKLGVGPLTRAYAKLARDVIDKDNIAILVKGYDIDIVFNYDNIKNIDYILNNSNIISKEFNDNVKYNVHVNEVTLNKLSNYNIKVNKEMYIEKE